MRRRFSKLNVVVFSTFFRFSRSLFSELLLYKIRPITPKKTGELRSSLKINDKRSFKFLKGIVQISAGVKPSLHYAIVRHNVPAKRYTTPNTSHKFISKPVTDNFLKIFRRSISRTRKHLRI